MSAGTSTAPKSIQERIDEIEWYHEYDFGNGLRATSRTPDVVFHRRLWKFIETELAKIDFRDKTVLDIGCWDGYWSFYAERRGARSVLATDDATQNWAGSSGLLLAKELLGSNVTTDLQRSIYDLASLDRKFDVILCLGVYYHLIDPVYSFAQIRHCCHPDTVVVLEGEATAGLRPDSLIYDLANPALPKFVPTPHSLEQMLRAAYLDVVSQTWARPPKRRSVRKLARMVWQEITLDFARRPRNSGRLVTVCRPFARANPVHYFRPPFDLHRYDDRFSG